MAEVERIRARKTRAQTFYYFERYFFFRSIFEHKGKSLRIFQKLLEKLFTDISEHLFAIK